MFDAERIRKLEKPLLAWYAKSARALPWRQEPTPYHVWVSEIMLQQTRVEAVRPYYHRFMQALPDIGALARCPEDTLLKLWEGLGYYSRARNLKKAAGIVMRDYDGQLPADEKALRSLPGIGSYTAGAVSSIAFSLPVPAVDGNVLRVMSRICESEEDILDQKVRRDLEQTLSSVIPKDAPGAYNQALMELGAMICLPNGAPDCGHCPVRDLCLSHLHDACGRIPVRRAKKERRIEQRTVLVIRDALHVVIGKRPERGLLAGLYELPSLPGRCTEEEVLSYVRSLFLSPVRILPLPDAKHVFTHVEWHMAGYLVLVEDMQESRTIPAEGTGKNLVPDDKVQLQEDPLLLAVAPRLTRDAYVIPSAFKAFAPVLEIDIGNMRFRTSSGPDASHTI